MGSRGTGRFGDYSPKRGETLCNKPLRGVALEDVGQSQYFQTNGNVPSIGIKVRIRDTVANGRLVVELESGIDIVGNIPTKFNYLLACLKAGNSYSGEVSYSSQGPIPAVEVNLDAQ